MAIFLPPTMLAASIFVPPATSYANPGGTGDRTASITVTATATLGGMPANNLIDNGFGNNTTDSVYNSATSGVTNGGFKFFFGAGSQKYIDEFKWFQNVSSSQGTWVFEGSNDDSSWTPIGSSFTLDGISSGSTFAVPHSIPAPYDYYRLRQTGGSSAGQPYMQEIQFKIG